MSDPHDLDRRSTAWVAAGLISADQREAIRRFEDASIAADERPRRLSLAAEVAVYVGSVFALSGGAMAIGNAWSDLAFGGRLAVALAVGVIGLGVGHWLFSVGEPGTDRVAGYVSSLGVGGVSFVAGLVADEAGGRDSSWVACAVGAGMLVASAAVWRNLDRPLQAASAALGFGIAISGLVGAVDGEMVIAGLVLIAVGCAAFAAAHADVLRPRLIVSVAAGALAYVGAYMLWDVSDRLAPAIAIVVALLVVAHGVRFEQLPLVVLGILGATVATTTLLAETFDGAVSAAVVALLGLALVVVVVGRSFGRRDETTSAMPPPPAGG